MVIFVYIVLELIIYNVRVVDKKAPRFGKGDFSKVIINKENLYKKFIKNFPQFKDKSWEEILEAWLLVTDEIKNQVTTNPLGVKLKFYIGDLKLQYVPYKMKSLTYGEGEFIRQLNLHSRDKVAVLKWERRSVVRYNKWLQYFAFDPARDLQRAASNAIYENPEKFRTSRVTLGGRRNVNK